MATTIIMTEADTQQMAIRKLLNPEDRILVSLPCRIRQLGTGFVKADAVLVTHEVRGNEEAALLVCLSGEAGARTKITHVLPIDSRFKHNLLQTPPSPSVSYFHQSSRPHIALDLRQGDESYELRIAAHHSLVVQSLTKELRRLTEVIRHSSTPLSLQHEWLGIYPVSAIVEADCPSTGTTMSETSPRDTSAFGIMATDTGSAATPVTSMTGINEASASVENDEHPNPYLPTFSRPTFLRKRLFGRASEWSENKSIKIRCATYNVNDKLPPKGTTELASLVGDGSDDLLVFGFQEADVRHQALLFAQGNDRAIAWEEALFRGLGDRASEFEKLAFSQYVGVMTIVLVRKTLRSVITRVETSEKGIGLMGFVGNKAGVAVRLKTHDTTLAFVNCHLAAFANALERRRLDYNTLSETLSFPRPLESEVSVLAHEEFLPDQPDRLLSLQDSNAIFWLGDLNYRIAMEDDKLAPLVKWKRWQEVLEHDQLRSDMAQGLSFAGFQEAPISFPPSYKYVHGSTTLDTRRVAAYTDRVLYTTPSTAPSSASSDQASIVTAGTYTSHEILWSDHRPVTCDFQVKVRVADEDKRKVALAQVRSELDKLDEEWAPSIEVDHLELDFGDIRYRRAVTRDLVLRNKGRVPAKFDFRAPPGKGICKPIYWPFPASGTLDPGAETVLQVISLIDAEWSSKLTVGAEEANDVLVLQVTGGKDTFITLQANYLPSIVGLPLTQLNKLPDGIRQIPLAQRKLLSDAVPLLTPKDEAEDPHEGKPAKAVKPAQVMWRLLESLMEKHDGTLWAGEQHLEDILDVIEALDANTPLPNCSPSTMSHTVIHLLAALPTSLVPNDLQKQCCLAEDRDEGYAILEGVEGVHTNILIGLMSVVRLCDADAALNTMTVESLVPAVFGPQRETERDEAEYERQGRIRFVKLLLEG